MFHFVQPLREPMGCCLIHELLNKANSIFKLKKKAISFPGEKILAFIPNLRGTWVIPAITSSVSFIDSVSNFTSQACWLFLTTSYPTSFILPPRKPSFFVCEPIPTSTISDIHTLPYKHLFLDLNILTFPIHWFINPFNIQILSWVLGTQMNGLGSWRVPI